MSNQRKFLLIVEDNPSGTTWVEIEVDEFQSCWEHPREYDIFVFPGLKWHVSVAVWNKCCGKQKALKTASSFVFGTYHTVHLDPEDGMTYFETGQALDHPPH